MDNNFNQLTSKILYLILKTLNDNKNIRSKNKKIFTVDKILSVNTKNCKYVGGERGIEIKPHLYIKFTSIDETCPIYMSILLEKYSHLIPL